MIWINHKKVTTPGSWVPNMVVHDIEWPPVFPSFTRDSHQSRVSQDEPVVENFIYFSKIPVFYLFITDAWIRAHLCANVVARPGFAPKIHIFHWISSFLRFWMTVLLTSIWLKWGTVRKAYNTNFMTVLHYGFFDVKSYKCRNEAPHISFDHNFPFCELDWLVHNFCG